TRSAPIRESDVCAAAAACGASARRVPCLADRNAQSRETAERSAGHPEQFDVGQLNILSATVIIPHDAPPFSRGAGITVSCSGREEFSMMRTSPWWTDGDETIALVSE